MSNGWTKLEYAWPNENESVIVTDGQHTTVAAWRGVQCETLRRFWRVPEYLLDPTFPVKANFSGTNITAWQAMPIPPENET